MSAATSLGGAVLSGDCDCEMARLGEIRILSLPRSHGLLLPGREATVGAAGRSFVEIARCPSASAETRRGPTREISAYTRSAPRPRTARRAHGSGAGGCEGGEVNHPSVRDA